MQGSFHKNSDCVVKLMDDSVKICRYKLPQREYKKYDDWHKQHIVTGELKKYEFRDALKWEQCFCAGVRRSRKTIVAISDRNKFCYHLTITFNPAYINRRSKSAVHQAYKNVLKRLKYHFGGIEYISVAEFHQDGEGIHFHIMINFNRPPRTTFKKYTNRGHALYTFHYREEFKRSDCFLTLQKLKENNVGYLIKYITKNGVFPMPRRYNTSRGLIRPQTYEKILVSDKHIGDIRDAAEDNGFVCRFNSEKTEVYEYKPKKEKDTGDGVGGLPPTDLSYIGIKDETLEDIFYKLIEDIMERQRDREFYEKTGLRRLTKTEIAQKGIATF